MNKALKAVYNRIAEDWHHDHQTDDWWVAGTDHFAARMPAGGTVLDIGCGAGAKSKYLRDKGLMVTGIDFSEKMIALAKQEVSQVGFRVLALEEVNQLDDQFDGIFMQAVLLHVPKADARERVRAIGEQLRDSGYFYIAVKERRLGGVEEEVKVEDDYGYSYERFFSYFSLDEIEGYLKAAGCSVVYRNVSRSGNTDWIQVIGQKRTKHPMGEGAL